MTEDNIEATEQIKEGANVLFPAVIGSALATILGGVLWGYLAILTGHEIGFVAWALGGLSGVSVVLFAKGKSGISFQVIAVLSSMPGITIGKYLFFFDSVKKIFKGAYGVEAANNVSLFSIDLMRVFVENIGTTLGGLNMLWVFLAVITAWSIPKRMRRGKTNGMVATALPDRNPGTHP